MTAARTPAGTHAAGTPHRRVLPREVKALAEAPRVEPASGEFEGYASLFGVPDLARDVVMPGAFAESLRRRGARGVRMLWQHDPGEPLGRWLEIAEDGRGLRVRGRLNLAVARAREAYALLSDGSLDGLSIGYRVERSAPGLLAGERRLERLDLWEISLVTFPMHPGARVRDAKAARSARLAAAIRRATGRSFGPG